MEVRRWLAWASLGICALSTLSSSALAQSQAETESVIRQYFARHPEEIQKIVKDYLLKNPDVLEQAIAELIKKRQGTAAVPAAHPDKTAAIKSNAKQLFDSPHQAVLGNPQGDVTLVEFFDYNCGYCKRALSDTLALLKDDPKLRIVLKEFPILGPGSAEAARVAIAVRMQDALGEKYLAFHEKMLSDRGQATKAQAMAHAASAGLDMARLEQDMASGEIDLTIQESVALARTLGINGTPGYVIGDIIVPGAVGAASLKDKIAAVRRHPG